MRIILPHFGRVLALVVFTWMPSLVSATPQPAVLTVHANTMSGSLGILFDYDTQTLVEITSISLTIDRQKYKLKDVDFGFPPETVGDYTIIGGVKNGIEQVFSGTHDFLLLWVPASNGAYFAYSRPGMKSTVNEFAVVTLATDGLAALPNDLTAYPSATDAFRATTAASIISDEPADHAVIVGRLTRRRLARSAII